MGGQADGWKGQERGKVKGGKTAVEKGGWVGGDTHTPAGKKDKEIELRKMCLASLGDRDGEKELGGKGYR